MNASFLFYRNVEALTCVVDGDGKRVEEQAVAGDCEEQSDAVSLAAKQMIPTWQLQITITYYITVSEGQEFGKSYKEGLGLGHLNRLELSCCLGLQSLPGSQGGRLVWSGQEVFP